MRIRYMVASTCSSILVSVCQLCDRIFITHQQSAAVQYWWWRHDLSCVRRQQLSGLMNGANICYTTRIRTYDDDDGWPRSFTEMVCLSSQSDRVQQLQSHNRDEPLFTPQTPHPHPATVRSLDLCARIVGVSACLLPFRLLCDDVASRCGWYTIKLMPQTLPTDTARPAVYSRAPAMFSDR